MLKHDCREKGKLAEELAVQYLVERGFEILKQNYRYERGEIDIIAKDGEEIVFVEVKARLTDKYGLPEESVTEEKQNRVYSVAEGYLYENNLNEKICRFDVIAVEIHDKSTEIRHIRNAF